MCGIAGVVGAGSIEPAVLDRMAATMGHRGPDDQGIWHEGGTGLAFRRLAIIDLHERSSQPMHLGSLRLVFNGEIYNYLELRDELERAGHHFVTEGDAEVLLHAWAEWRQGALNRLNGAFAFAVWDATSCALTLAVDRFAEKPLYVHRTADRLVFASEVRALRAVDPAIGVPDEAATERFLALGTMPPLPSTFFRDVQRLGPSHVATLQSGTWKARRYWSPSQVAVPPELGAASARLNELLRSSVRIRLRSDVPVGTSLSGGVDSSVVAVTVGELAPDHRRHAFTATFSDFERDEWAYAAAAAERAGIAHHHAVRPTFESMQEDLRKLVAAQEEPFGSTSIYAQWCVMQAAREAGVVVLLDGQGADELFGGYAGAGGWALRSLGLRHAVLGAFGDPSVIRETLVAYLAGRAPRWLARRERLKRASPYVRRRDAILAADWEPPAPDWPDTPSAMRRELLNQAFRTSLPNLCRFADKNSMSHSVEVRLPFLDPGVAEFALSLKPDLLYQDGITKRVLRAAARGRVPDSILNRRDKIGFETPERRWFNAPTGLTTLSEIILSDSLPPAIDRHEIERDMKTGLWRDVGGIWRVASVTLWLSSLRADPVEAFA